MSLKARVENLCLVVLADTWADLSGIVEEFRAESDSGLTKPVPGIRGFVHRGPFRRTRAASKDVRDRVEAP